MKYEVRDNIMTVQVSGRIDTSNASEVEAELMPIVREHTDCDVVIDLDELDYISSVGLRLILRILKMVKCLSLINANAEVYDILEMTGFTEMMTVVRAFERISVDGCPIIGKGAKGTIYRWTPDTIVKVYRDPNSLPDIKRERELARMALVLGVPTAISFKIVRVGESYGSVFELIDAKAMSAAMAEAPEHLSEYAKMFAELLKTVHSSVIKPDELPSAKKIALEWVDSALPLLQAEDAARLQRMAQELPDPLTLLHNDFHPNNVMLQNGEAVLIDMDTLSTGHPVIELANTYFALVGSSVISREMLEKFIHNSLETSREFWNLFLADYLGTQDEAVLKKVESCARLLFDCRMVRHICRRNLQGDPSYSGALKTVLDDIHATLPGMNSFVW